MRRPSAQKAWTMQMEGMCLLRVTWHHTDRHSPFTIGTQSTGLLSSVPCCAAVSCESLHRHILLVRVDMWHRKRLRQLLTILFSDIRTIQWSALGHVILYQEPTITSRGVQQSLKGLGNCIRVPPNSLVTQALVLGPNICIWWMWRDAGDSHLNGKWYEIGIGIAEAVKLEFHTICHYHQHIPSHERADPTSNVMINDLPWSFHFPHDSWSTSISMFCINVNSSGHFITPQIRWFTLCILLSMYNHDSSHCSNKTIKCTL